MMDEFKAKNRAASYRGGGNNDAMDMRAMRQLVQGLPQYRRADMRIHAHTFLQCVAGSDPPVVARWRK